MKVTLCVDQSTANAGFAVGNHGKMLDFGILYAPQMDSLFKRVNFLAQELKKLIRTYKVEIVYLEDVMGTYVGGPGTLRKLSEALGIYEAIFSLMENPPEVKLLHPSTWKSACGWKVNKGKPDRAFVEALTDRDLSGCKQDTLDAICMLLAIGGTGRE